MILFLDIKKLIIKVNYLKDNLLEARGRFLSNIEFGQWLSVNFTELNSSNTGKLINLAKYFQGDKTLEGISISAGYLIASPNNREIADKVVSMSVYLKNKKVDILLCDLDSQKSAIVWMEYRAKSRFRHDSA